jgi:hypothetical protein
MTTASAAMVMTMSSTTVADVACHRPSRLFKLAPAAAVAVTMAGCMLGTEDVCHQGING